jgi:hypothetical protein
MSILILTTYICRLEIFMRYLIFSFFIFTTSLSLHAQIPQAGIYQFNNQQSNYFGANHYARFFNSIDDFLSLKIIPYKEVNDYGLNYAIIAVNQAKTQIKIVFLRDTVSTEGKKQLIAISRNSTVDHPKNSYFSQEFSIQKDSVITQSSNNSSLAGTGNLTGEWSFNSNNSYDYFGLYKNPLIKNQSIKDTISGKYQNGMNYQFEQAFFVGQGKRPKAYIDLRTNVSEDKILIYDKPGTHPLVKDYFRKGETIAITADDSAQWYEVDRIEVRKDTGKYYSMDSGMQEGTALLQTISGWIKKEDLASSPWVRQQQQTNKFRFEISADKEFVNAVKIINKKTGSKQVLLDIWAGFKSIPTQVIQIGDYNFDGYPDFMFLMQSGGAGPNYTNNFYLYNPQKDNFEYNDELSQLSQVEVEVKSRTISSNWRDGAAHHGGERYTFIDHQLTKTAYWDQYAGMGFFVQENSGELVNGKWIDHQYKGAEILTSTAAVYQYPDKQIASLTLLKKGDYALIKGENSKFFQVEVTTASHHLIKGWIEKEHFFPKTSLLYIRNTPLYNFELIKDQQSSPVAVKIITRADGRTLQYITELDEIDSTNTTLYIDDYNFDGYPDFSLKTSSKDDVELGNFYEKYYLYDHTADLFSLDTLLSKSPNVTFDQKSKSYSSTEFVRKDNVITKNIKKYKLVNENYILIKE